MLIAGLTGGLASGKTFVAEAFRALGAHVVEADLLGHEVMQPGEPAYHAIVKEFGPEILTVNGGIDRPRLAGIVFHNSAALARLNAIVHPAVRELAKREFERIRLQDPHAITIYVAAILIETGSARDFDKLIVVASTREQQIERALGRGKASEAEILARMSTQLPLEEKKRFADFVIDTSGTKEETLRQTKMVYKALRILPA